MKKILLISIFALLSFAGRASDTLTVRQVYNFSVGDTFDYQTTTFNYDFNINTVTYSRQVINQKAWGSIQDTIIYNNSWIITNLDSIAILQMHGFDSLGLTVVYFDTTSYSGYLSNRLSMGGIDVANNYTVTAGLGLTREISYSVSSNPNFPNFTDKKLIYFSNGNQSFGIPYYILAGVNDLTNTPTITLYPNPTSDQLHLSISDASHHYQFILTDLFGSELLSQPITDKETTLNISHLASGLYTWRLTSDNAMIKTGKVVKE